MSDTTGLIPFSYDGETFETWYRVVGDLNSGIRPLVIVHGGPAIPSVYLYAHTELHKAHNIPIVFYHQLGCGNSTHLPTKSKDFWTVALFSDELQNVLAYLKIEDNFDLYGHSWGGMLIADYVATRQPPGLRRLIISCAPASMELYMKAANELVDSTRYATGFGDAMRKHEREGTTNSEEYGQLVKKYVRNHICLMDPWPQDLLDGFGELSKDPTVNRALFGEYELSCNGNLVDWSVIDRLNRITYPTLVLNGAEDSAQDVCVKPYVDGIPKVRWVRYGKSSHMPWFEEKDLYFRGLAEFLH